MKRRYALFGMTAVLAMSLAIPAFGGPGNPVADTFADAKTTAVKALKKARAAKKAAKAAQNSADDAQATADGAKTAADNAKTAADNAQASADAAQATADSATTDAAAAQSTADSKYGQSDFNFGTLSPSDSNASKIVFAGCDPGFTYTGGGFEVAGAGNQDVTVTTSEPYINNNWSVIAEEIGAGTASNWTLRAVVMCVAP